MAVHVSADADLFVLAFLGSEVCIFSPVDGDPRDSGDPLPTGFAASLALAAFDFAGSSAPDLGTRLALIGPLRCHVLLPGVALDTASVSWAPVLHRRLPQLLRPRRLWLRH